MTQKIYRGLCLISFATLLLVGFQFRQLLNAYEELNAKTETVEIGDGSRLAEFRWMKTAIKIEARVEGAFLPIATLRSLRQIAGEPLLLETLIRRRKPTLFLLFTLRACNTCIDQEITIIETDSMLIGMNANVVYVCPDSAEFELTRYYQVRGLRYPLYQDLGDNFRKAFGLAQYSPIAFVVEDGRILFVNLPNRDNSEASYMFLSKFKRLMRGQVPADD